MDRIYLSSCGIIPGCDITEKLHEIFNAHPSDTEFVFDKGDYYFSPKLSHDYRLSNTDVIPERKLGIWLRDMKNIKIDCSGSRFLFSGHMSAVTLDNCENVEIRNCIIDWPKPLAAEGIVTGLGDGYIDMFVSSDIFPHHYRDGWLEFDVGNGEWYPMSRYSHIQFDAVTRTVRRASGDRFSAKTIEDLGGDIYRFGCGYTDTSIGNIFVLRHNERMHAGIFTERCRSVVFEDITFHSCGGLGCLAQFCTDLTYRRVNFLPNTKAGRKVANGRDDGMHITCCSGRVTITECSFTGLMDDPINVHGCCVTAAEAVDSRTLRCRFRHPQAQGFFYWVKAGDEIAFIERRHMETLGTLRASGYSLETRDTFLISFESDIPSRYLEMIDDPECMALDNLTNTAEFVCTDNRFGSCRARGILVSTPKPVLIARNIFASSGCAVLVAGDANYWFESGACHDVEIRDNVFTDACLSSMYQFCEGIISICPVVPEPKTDKPFHSNIRITGNRFDTPDTPVLYAFSCKGLSFTGNTITSSPCADKWHGGTALIKLDHCIDAELSGNLKVGSFNLNDIETADCENIKYTVER